VGVVITLAAMARGTHDLDHLTESIANAMHHAQSITEEQHLELLDRYFEHAVSESGEHIYRAKVVQVRVPHFGSDNPAEDEIVEVPLITLIPMGSMLIEEMTVEFQATLETVQEHPNQPPDGQRPPGWHKRSGPFPPFGQPGGKIGSGLASGGGKQGAPAITPLSQQFPESQSEGRRMVVSMSKAASKRNASNVNITITFKKGDPPEGLVRMNGVVVKQIP